MCKKTKIINKVCACLIVIVILCFLFIICDIASFIYSVKITVIESCQFLVSLYNNSTQTVNTITIDELKSAQNYILEAAEFFSVASNNSIISIIYAFSTTVILTIGSFIVARINKKSDDFSDKISNLETTYSGLSKTIKNLENDSKNLIDSISDMKNQQTSLNGEIKDMQSCCRALNTDLYSANNEISCNTEKMKILKDLYLKSLDLQNISNYTNYAIMIFRECELNLEQKRDNFDLLNVVYNSLCRIPEQYVTINIENIKTMFVNETTELGELLYSNLVDLKNQYKSLIKHYFDLYKIENNTFKLNQKEILCDSIDELKKDLINRMNNDFFALDV